MVKRSTTKVYARDSVRFIQHEGTALFSVHDIYAFLYGGNVLTQKQAEMLVWEHTEQVLNELQSEFKKGIIHQGHEYVFLNLFDGFFGRFQTHRIMNQLLKKKGYDRKNLLSQNNIESNRLEILRNGLDAPPKAFESRLQIEETDLCQQVDMVLFQELNKTS